MRLGYWILVVTLLLGLSLITITSGKKAAVEEDDFAEFDDDFEEDLAFRKDKNQKPKKIEPEFEEIDDVKEPIADPKPTEPTPPRTPREVKETLDEDEEVMVEDDDFDGIDDDDFDDDNMELGGGSNNKKRDSGPQKLTITPVPMPMRGGFQAYWAELLMLTGISVYLLNYVMGRYKNQKIAQVFFESHWKTLEENFHLLGDNGSKIEEDLGSRDYVRMSDSLFQMWCSGRVCCEGMLVELKLLKRQDIVAIISNIFRPAKDVFRFTVEFAKEDMDSIVFALATKKTAMKISKEYNDLINYCPDKKPADKFGISNQFVIMSELTEVISSILDQRTVSVINKCAPYIDSIHITDQFTGTKTAEPEMTKEGVMKAPEPKRFIIFTFILPTNTSGNNVDTAVEEIQSLLPFVLYTVDRFKRIRLSKEGKIKADKNRAKVEEAFMKQTHQARADALAARKEEKRRLEKERILQEEDPEKQRRWEEKEQKREKKKKQPKLKQLKVKAM